MAEVKWIKIVTDMFDNRKIRQIESLPDGDGIIVIWLKILCIAGDVNDGGMVYFTKDIPYTEQMFASQFNRPLALIQIALKTFERFGMIEIVDDFMCVSNWEKYQNIGKMNEIREYNRLAQQKSRAKKRGLLPVNNVSMTSQLQSMQCQDIDIDKEKEKEKREKNIFFSKKESLTETLQNPLQGEDCEEIPPPLTAVQAYIEQEGLNINAAQFVDYYTAIGWKVGANPVVDWKSLCKAWETNTQGARRGSGKPEAFKSRTYTAEEQKGLVDKLDEIDF